MACQMATTLQDYLCTPAGYLYASVVEDRTRARGAPANRTQQTP
jgi:hypothetical protein